MKIPFDQYQRYKNTQKIINSVRRDGEHFKILEVGANEHRNLEHFLPDDDIKYLDIKLSDDCLNSPQYILGDATDMQFEDNYFDIIVALDVYEHIPPERRENFLSEINRVCKNNFIICAPMQSERIQRAEERVNEVYKTINSKDFIWLKEHSDNVLPSLDWTKEFFKENNIKFKSFCHGTLEIWEILMSITFFSTLYPQAYSYRIMIDEFYNDEIFENDYNDEDFYRAFFVGEKSRAFDINSIIKERQDTSWRYSLNILKDNFFNLLNITCFRHRDAKYFAELFYDTGSGFSQVDRLEAMLNIDGHGYFSIGKKFSLSRISGIKRLRFDPVNSSCVIDGISVTATRQSGEIVDLLTKAKYGFKTISGKTVFISNDPQILLDTVDESDPIVEVDISMSGTVYENLPDYLIDAYESDMANLKNKLSKEKMKNMELKSKVTALQRFEDEVKSSMFFKFKKVKTEKKRKGKN